MKYQITQTKLVFFYSVLLFLFSSVQTFAQAVVVPVSTCNLVGVSNFKSLVTIVINCFLRPSVVVIISLAVVIFLYKIFEYISTEGVEKKQAGREFMVWGIIGIFVMISLWGLVNVLQRTFTFNNDITPREVRINLP